MSGNGISWATCNSAPRSRQITTPAPHYSVFLQAGCPSCHPTNSVKALKANKEIVRSLHKNKANWTTQNCNEKHYSSLKKRISVTKVNNIMTVTLQNNSTAHWTVKCSRKSSFNLQRHGNTTSPAERHMGTIRCECQQMPVERHRR